MRWTCAERDGEKGGRRRGAAAAAAPETKAEKRLTPFAYLLCLSVGACALSFRKREREGEKGARCVSSCFLHVFLRRLAVGEALALEFVALRRRQLDAERVSPRREWPHRVQRRLVHLLLVLVLVRLARGDRGDLGLRARGDSGARHSRKRVSPRRRRRKKRKQRHVLCESARHSRMGEREGATRRCCVRVRSRRRPPPAAPRAVRPTRRPRSRVSPRCAPRSPPRSPRRPAGPRSSGCNLRAREPARRWHTAVTPLAKKDHTRSHLLRNTSSARV